MLREFSTYVPLTIAKKRLVSAFDSNIVPSSKGILFASYKYSGKLEGNGLDMDLTVSGRSQMNYHLSGYLSEDVNGTKLKFKVSPKISLWLILAQSLILLITPFFYSLLMPNQNIVRMIEMMCIVIILNFVVMRWHCTTTASNVIDLLNKIIKGQPYN